MKCSGEIHPAAELFPPMGSEDLLQLAEDIRAHGLLDPIAIHEGLVLDGRNRLRACELVGAEPRFVPADLNGMTPIEYVVSHNLHRRHLTIAQRAALALDLLPKLEEEARERMLAGKADPRPETDEGRSDEKAAAMVGVGRTTVAAAKAIAKRSPKVVEQMRAGELTVAAGARAAGFEGLGQGRGANGGPIEEGKRSVYYGKGDKFREATEPLRRYLAAWEGRDFEFRHVNPREAGKRIAVIDDLLGGLTAARADLEPRSHKATLTMGR